MDLARFGPKQDEYNFFSNAFKLIDEHRTDSCVDSLRALFCGIFCNGRRPECFWTYEKLACQAQAPAGLLIENWNEIPLRRIRRKGFAGYQQAVEEIFRRLANIYKTSRSHDTRCRIQDLMKQATGILKKRICQVGRSGLTADARVTGNHLHVIELWTRSLKVSMVQISYVQEVRISEEESDDFDFTNW